MKKLLCFVCMLALLAACEDKNEVPELDNNGIHLHASVNGGEFTEYPLVSYQAAEGGEFTVEMKADTHLVHVYECGDSSLEQRYGQKPDGKVIHRKEDGTELTLYVVYCVSWSNAQDLDAALPWSYDKRDWWEVTQTAGNRFQVKIKPCEGYRFLEFETTASVDQDAPGGFYVECLPDENE